MSGREMNEKDMIERYIYEVTRRVPQKMREEIKLELETLIDDMCNEEGCSIEEALNRLGDPAEFAKKYRGDKNYIVGPDYYDNYMWILKIGLIGLSISAVVAGIVEGIMGAEDVADFFANFIAVGISTIVSSGCAMIGVLTIIFGILEYKKVKVDIKPEEKWSPALLPAVPNKKSLISRADSVVNIIFIIAFGAILAFVPEVFGAFTKTENGMQSVGCVFNLDQWSRILPIFILSLAVGLVDEVVRLVYGQYCKVVLYSSIISNSIMAICSVILFKGMDIWNPQFASNLLIELDKAEYAKGDILFYWGTETFDDIMLGIFCLINVFGIAITAYKTYRYGKR